MKINLNHKINSRNRLLTKSDDNILWYLPDDGEVGRLVCRVGYHLNDRVFGWVFQYELHSVCLKKAGQDSANCRQCHAEHQSTAFAERVLFSHVRIDKIVKHRDHYQHGQLVKYWEPSHGHCEAHWLGVLIELFVQFQMQALDNKCGLNLQMNRQINIIFFSNFIQPSLKVTCR